MPLAGKASIPMDHDIWTVPCHKKADHGRPLRFAGAADAKATGREDVQLQLTHDLTER